MVASENVTWEDPPPLGRKSEGHWEQVVATLKEKPGDWAVVATGGTHAGSFGSTQKRLKRLGCEAVQRKVSQTEWKLYARWPKGKK